MTDKSSGVTATERLLASLACHFPLELREGQQHVEHGPAHGVVVLNCCVTDTKDTPWRSNTSTILEKSARLRVRRSIL